MTRLIQFSFIFLLIILFSFNLSAEVDSLTVYDAEDSVIVVANRYQVSAKNLAYSYKVVNRESIQLMSGHSALEMVDIQNPSAFIIDKKVMGYGVGTGGAGQLNLRGRGGKPNSGVLVLLNGHPDVMGIFGHPLPDVYGMDDIQQVEILAGPASTVYGNHAMGGVINLVSGPDYSRLARFSMEGGSYGAFKLGLNFAKQFGKQGLFFTVRRKKSDGHISQSGFESTHFQGGWNYQINQAWNLSLQGRYVPYSFDDPSRGSIDNAGLGAFGEIKRGTGEIILKNQGKKLNGSYQVYLNSGNHKFYDGYESTDFTYGFSSYQHYKINSKISLASGADLIHYGGKAKNDFAFLPNGKPIVNPDKHQLTSFGLYVLGFYSPWQKLSLRGGFRYQHNSLPLDNISPVAGITYSPLPQINIYGNFQTGFRSPTLMELYLFPSANAQLKEEKMYSTEGGIRYSWNGRNEVRLALFKNRADNIIQTLSLAPLPGVRFSNSGQADQWGFESQVTYYVLRQMGIQLSYGHLDPDQLTAYNPKHQFKYMVFASRKNIRFSLYGKYVQDLFAKNNAQGSLPDYNLLNSSITLKVKQVDLHLKLLNILDRRYLVQPNYRAPGRQIRLGMGYSL